jgi:hypothetical protein
MSTPASAAARRSTGAVKAPSATVRRSASSSAAVRPFAQPLAEAEIARARRRAGEDQVAEAGKAGESLGASALRHAEAGHLGKAARDEGGARVLAEAPALDHSAGDGEHVLDRAADLRADHVVRKIGPEPGAGDPVAEPLAERPVLDRQRHGGGKAGRDLVREGGPREHRHRSARDGPRGRRRASAASSLPPCPSSRGSAARRCAASPTARRACAGPE